MTGRRDLHRELGGRVPEGLATLTDEERSELAGLVHDARRRQSQALDGAIAQALDIVPRLVRGPVRRILFGP